MRPLVILFFLLLSGASFTSCQKEFEDPGDPATARSLTSSFKAKINDVEFAADIYGAVRRSDNVISIAGKANDGKIMVFTVIDSGVHVYSLDRTSNVNFCGYEDNTGLAFSSNEGLVFGDSGGNLAIIAIDSVKRVMSGTFNLKVFRQLDRSQRIITEGVFNNIPY